MFYAITNIVESGVVMFYIIPDTLLKSGIKHQ